MVLQNGPFVMANFPLNVLIITPGFAADENDSATIPYLQDYVLALKNKIGADHIKIITIHYPFIKKKYLWNGIEVFPVNGKNKKGLFRLYTIRQAVSIAKKLLKKDRYVLHSFWLTDAAMVGQFISKKYRLKHICTIMGQDAKASNKYLKYIDLDQITSVVLSKQLDDIFHMATGKQANHYIPLAIQKIHPLTNEKRNIDLLFAGSFIPLKHPEKFVETVISLRTTFPEIKAVMIGEGNLFADIQSMIRKTDNGMHIELTGNIPRAEVFRYMARSKILVHPSEYEGSATVFAEALAHGMHVICFDVGRTFHENIHVCENDGDMITQTKLLMHKQLNFEPLQEMTIDASADAYITIYNS
ncbi:MAG: glycosyltransferase [Chitinophagales bacterium]|nr:glycosyltransferase [Chitinophagales bacterium]